MIKRTSIRVIDRKGHREIHLQLAPEQGETPAIYAERISGILQDHHAKVIRATFFGRLSEQKNTLECIGDRLSGIDFPHSWIEGDHCSDAFIGGAYIFAVSGLEVKRLRENDRIVGSYYKTGEAEFCCLGGLYSDPVLSPAEQTLRILGTADGILNKEGLSYDNTIRTWFYLDDILGWYDDFNRARTSFFLQHDIFNKLVPASTGIGGKNHLASRICLELTAIKPRSDEYSIERISSPLQCSAEEYGSAFSRAIMHSDSQYQSMTVSGTASIDRQGKTMHAGDLRKQIELSFSVIKAVLASRDFSFEDAVRAYAYCSDKRFVHKFNQYFNEYIEAGMPGGFACICAENKICRDELLFEVEVDVIKKKIIP